MSPEERRAAGVGPGCVRVAAGIEDPADLAADFLAALAASGPLRLADDQLLSIATPVASRTQSRFPV